MTPAMLLVGEQAAAEEGRLVQDRREGSLPSHPTPPRNTSREEAVGLGTSCEDRATAPVQD